MPPASAIRSLAPQVLLADTPYSVLRPRGALISHSPAPLHPDPCLSVLSIQVMHRSADPPGLLATASTECPHAERRVLGLVMGAPHRSTRAQPCFASLRLITQPAISTQYSSHKHSMTRTLKDHYQGFGNRGSRLCPSARSGRRARTERDEGAVASAIFPWEGCWRFLHPFEAPASHLCHKGVGPGTF